MTNIELPLRVDLCPLEPFHECFKFDAPTGVGLRVEEWLTIPHIHLGSFLKIIHGQLIEILLCSQHFHATIVCIEKCRNLICTFDAPRLKEVVHAFQFIQSGEGFIQSL